MCYSAGDNWAPLSRGRVCIKVQGQRNDHSYNLKKCHMLQDALLSAHGRPLSSNRASDLFHILAFLVLESLQPQLLAMLSLTAASLVGREQGMSWPLRYTRNTVGLKITTSSFHLHIKRHFDRMGPTATRSSPPPDVALVHLGLHGDIAAVGVLNECGDDQKLVSTSNDGGDDDKAVILRVIGPIVELQGRHAKHTAAVLSGVEWIWGC